MGTIIELKLGDISLDASKNGMGLDYGFLFQDEDEVRRKSDQISYEYYEENPSEVDLAESEASFARPLSRVLPRLQLLGYTLESARAEYNAIVNELGEDDDPVSSKFLTFDDLCKLACKYSLADLNSDYIDFETPERTIVAQGRFAAEKEVFDRIPYASESYWSESSLVSAKMCILSAPSMLQIFGLNQNNADTEVMWQFGPLVNSGWEKRESFQTGAKRTQKILIATEGKSDARIIKRTFEFLHPDILDFFSFITASEKYHFWGTGRLVNFAEGLIRIDVQNKILFILDNDAEGVDAYRKLQSLNLPPNMGSMLLPDITELKKFQAEGPEGVRECDINGRAAAIECYLDLDIPNAPPAKVRWSNYKENIKVWHGALENKTSYEEHFLKLSKTDVLNGNYDSAKLSKLLTKLVDEASQLMISE
ncbi:MAG: HEPN/Toprim-associated domain-containing protein [Akkermansiaceae bacterium]